MIASKYRFHGYGALKFLFGHGKTFRFKSVALRVARNERREHSRISVVVSKKVLKAAPKRNQVRRRIYEILREDWQHIAPGHDLLLSVHNPNILDLNHQELTREIQQAFDGAHIWRESLKKNQ
ncbi:MAG TPA: ribonuclease P protein component [Magnetospirillaceae bacterium]|nr:ribonuclease P protein component [Magnetospirillaceae bacterium]